MANHPVATAEQHEHERYAVELTEHPTVRAAYESVKKHWLASASPAPSADMKGCFDWAFEEVMFSAAIWSANQDPLRPKVIAGYLASRGRTTHKDGAKPRA